MGYQLYCVMLCGVVVGGVVGVMANGHGPVAVSAASCGTEAGIHAVQTLPEVAVQFGGVPAELSDGGSVLVTLRSAGSCSSRIAFGLIGLGTPAEGGIGPRANPSCSHSPVTGCQTPDASLYSTRNHPSIRFQDVELARLEGAGA